MSDEVQLNKETNNLRIPPAEEAAADQRSAVCQVGKTSWLKGWLAMAICCGLPVLVLAAISLFGASFAGIGSGLLSVAAVLACPVGMYLMMRIMMNKK